MKKYFLYILILISCWISVISKSYSQDWSSRINQQNQNFFNIVDEAEQYYGSDSILRASNLYGYKSYMRWKSFWTDRISASGIPGDMNGYTQAIISNSGNRASYCNYSGTLDNWTSLGPNFNLPSTQTNLGMCTSISINSLDPTNNDILAGFANGGIFHTTDGGQNWSNVTDNANLSPVLGISVIVRDPLNPLLVYAGTGAVFGDRGYGGGILKSNDGGNTWTWSTSIGNYESVQSISINPNFPNQIFVATPYRLYYSDNFGLSFNLINGFNLETIYSNQNGIPIVVDMAFSLEDPNFLFISTGIAGGNSGGGKIYRFHGDWANNPLNPIIDDVTPPLSIIGNNPIESFKIETCPANVSTQSKLYVMAVPACGNSSSKSVYFIESNDPIIPAGISYTPTGTFLSGCNNSDQSLIHFYKAIFSISPVDENVVYFGGLNLYYTRDKLASNAHLISSGHIDIRTIEIANSTPGGVGDIIFWGNDGGIDYSNNGGTSSNNINGLGLNTNIFYGVGISNDIVNGSSIYIAGAQDNLFYKFDAPNSPSIFGSGSGDRTYFRFDRNDPQKGIGLSLYNYIYITTDGANTSSTLNFSLPESFYPLAKPVIHESNTYFFGFHNLYILNDPYGDYCWTKISSFDTPNDIAIRRFAVTPTDVGKIYLAQNNIIWGLNDPIEKVVYRSTFNGFYQWEDITPNIAAASDPGYNVFNYAAVTDIEVNPENESEIWISFSGIANTDGTDRVFHSTDYGNSWTDISLGLPRYPVNSLVYQNGTGNSKIIYAATDVGVYVWDEINNQWNCYSNNLPTCIVNDIEIDYVNNKLVAATLGRGLYTSPLQSVNLTLSGASSGPQFSFNNGSSTTISAPYTLWDNDKLINGDVIIAPGAKLVITGSVSFTPNSKVIIERGDANHRGGILDLIGGSLKSISFGCPNNDFWQGVEVHGYPNESQEGLTKQGLLFMDNNAKIEYAEIGAIAGKGSYNSFFDFSYSGGIIKSYRSTFENNKTDVLFLAYQNFLPSNLSPIANKSYFYDCSFFTTNRALLTPGITPYNLGPVHMFLIGVTGIKFQLCEFKSLPLSYNTPFQEAKAHGAGIVSLNSSFHLLGNCPDNSSNCLVSGHRKGNVFKYLFYGVYAGSSNISNSVEINKNLFEQNYHGVFLNGIIAPSIYNNRFNCINYDDQSGYGNDIPYSLHLNQCTGYEVEENHFTAVRGGGFLGIGNFPKVGIQVSMPDAQSNQIYNNDIGQQGTNGFGIFVQGNANDLTPGFSGLQLLCNDFTIASTPPPLLGSPTPVPSTFIYLTQNGKINSNQGAATTNNPVLPAGNTFNNASGTNHANCLIPSATNFDEYNLQNGGTPQFSFFSDPHVIYYHHTESFSFATKPLCFSGNYVQLLDVQIQYPSKIGACPSTPSINFPIHDLLQLHNHYASRKLDESGKIDGGKTAELLMKIYNNTSPGVLRNSLIAYSPYLSDEVLLAAINNKPTPLPYGILKEILLANSPLSADVWNSVKNLNPALPTGIMNQLEAAQVGVSERTKLESVIDHYENFDQAVLYDVLRKYLLADTIPGYLDSALNFIGNYDFKFKECRLAEVLVAKKEYGNALNIIDQHLLSDPDDDICKLQKLLIEFDQTLNYCFSMDTIQKQKLSDLIEERSKACASANMILKTVFNHPFPDERIIEADTRSAINQREPLDYKDPVSNFNLYPNPGYEYVYVEYFGEQAHSKINIELFSIEGKIMQNQKVAASKNLFFIPLVEIPPGTYFVKVIVDDCIIGVKKLVVIK